MEPHRSSYPDESEPRWYRGEQQYPESDGQPRYEPQPGEAGYRGPGLRGGARMPPVGQPGMAGPAGPWPGEPPLPADMGQRDPTRHRDPTQTGETFRAMGRPAGPVPAATSTRRARRPAAAAMIVIAAAAVALPVLRILLASAFGASLSASGVISSVLMLLGLPLGAIGLYGLATGAARVPDAPAPHAWLRPPVAYVTVALALFVAAGLAAA